MKHKTVIKNLISWMEEKLSESQQQELEDHLRECPNCREYYQAFNPGDSYFQRENVVDLENGEEK